jgi:hypothetical protein
MFKGGWSKIEELNFVKDIANSKTMDELSIKYVRTKEELQHRLSKIIYDNIISGKSIDKVSAILKIPLDKSQSLFNSYITANAHLLKDKPQQMQPQHMQPQHKQSQQMQAPNIQKSGCVNDFKFLENENKIMKIIIENKNLKKEINDLIKLGRVNKEILKVIQDFCDTN